ncbi:MAG: histidinol-phosphatase [Desulfopila sp.]
MITSALIDTSCDGHIHTRLCGHATGEMEEYVQAAIDKGLAKMVFLEHREAGINTTEPTWLSEDDFDYYYQEGMRLRQRYADQIEIGIGMEVGYNPACRDELYEKIVARTWDRIGISCHFLPIGDTGKHLNLLSRQPENGVIARQLGVDKLLTAYFQTIHEAIVELPGTVICHLDAGLRHVPERRFDDSHFQQIDALLAAMKERGMALEINTSGIHYRHEPFPNRQILAMALRHQIPLTASSDAHQPADIARFFDQLPAYVQSALDS